MKKLNLDVSVIIPCFENYDSFKKSFNSVINQQYKPKEIIIVDSSKSNRIKNYTLIQKQNNKLIEIVYFHQSKLYPGKARNLGVQKSKYECIAFLDSKTIANKNWLFDYINFVYC